MARKMTELEQNQIYETYKELDESDDYAHMFFDIRKRENQIIKQLSGQFHRTKETIKDIIYKKERIEKERREKYFNLKYGGKTIISVSNESDSGYYYNHFFDVKNVIISPSFVDVFIHQCFYNNIASFPGRPGEFAHLDFVFFEKDKDTVYIELIPSSLIFDQMKFSKSDKLNFIRIKDYEQLDLFDGSEWRTIKGSASRIIATYLSKYKTIGIVDVYLFSCFDFPYRKYKFMWEIS